MNLLRNLWIAAVFCMTGLASAANDPSIEEIRQFLDGDSKLWPRFEQCAEGCANCSLIAGHVSLKSDEHDQAESYFISALQKGNRAAPWAMILLNIERNRPIEIFAWSQFTLATFSGNKAERIEANRKSWSFLQLAQTALNFNDEQWTLGEQRSQQLIEQWLPVLQADRDRETQDASCEQHIPIKQQPPDYPRRLTIQRLSGWAVVDFAVNEKGEVIDQIAILYSDEQFARASTRAIRKWEFGPIELTEHNQACATQRYRQTFDFEMDD